MRSEKQRRQGHFMEHTITHKINRFGKIGKAITLFLIVLLSIVILTLSLLTLLSASISGDSIRVSVASEANISIQNSFLQRLGILDLIKEGRNTSHYLVISPWDLGSAGLSIEKQGDTAVFRFAEKGRQYSLKRLLPAFFLSTLYAVSLLIVMLFLKSLMQGFAQCQTPFSMPIVEKMRAFMFSLIPAIVLHSVSKSLWESLLRGRESIHLHVEFGGEFLFFVIFVLVSIFKYGVLLQKESDETL